ncbi:MAG: RND transporter [unclassified Hahellaceae]|nr:RND transporter [Hahellaceae bacterium]|tara:strand:+ start:69753 stop:73034 length:3282 start_codon:yes stop_codon:yes gene_type:complete
MRDTIDWFINNPRVSNLLALMLVFGGLLAIPQTRQETLPNVPLERIGVVSLLPGASPQTIEQLLCTPIENVIYGIEGITDLMSDAREGRCAITVDVLEGFATRDVRDQIATRVAALNDLPEDASPPLVEELVFRNRVSQVLLTGDLSPRDLYTAAREMRRRMLDYPEISQVEIEGLPEREVAVEVSRSDLYRFGLSFSDLATAISNDVERVTGGLLRTPQSDALIQAGEAPVSADEYRKVLVRQGGAGDTLRLEEVATVVDGFSQNTMGAWLNGQPAAALDVYRIGNQNVLDVADAVRNFMAETPLPQGMRLVLWQDDAEEYRGRSELLWRNAAQALLVLVLILTLFLGLRMSVWVAAGIPVSMLGACILLPLLGESFNTISLFAFILVLGIVVDDAIVVGESVHDEIGKTGHSRSAVARGTNKVAKPVVFAVLTTALAFTPLLFLPGPEGELMRVIPIVAIGILILSLVESLWILPAHLNSSEPKTPGRLDRLSDRMNARFDRLMTRFFVPVLEFTLYWRYTLVAAASGLILLSLALVHSGWLTLVMFSRVEGDRVMADVVFPEGTSTQRVAETVQALQHSGQALAEQMIIKFDEPLIVDVLAEQGHRRKISTASDPDAHRRARVSLALAPGERPISADELAYRWRSLHQGIPDALSVRFHASLTEIKPDIYINLYHPNLGTLETMGRDLQAQLEQLDGLHEIGNSMNARFTQIQVSATPAARHYGLTERALGQQVAAAFHGVIVDRLPEDDHEVPVVLRLPTAESNSLWHLEQLPITLADGSSAPLSALATLQEIQTPALISHYDRRRTATLTALVDDNLTSPGQVMEHLQANWLGNLAQQYPGATWAVAGKPKAIAEFIDYLGLSYLLALIGMFCLLTIAFGTYWQPILILLAIPFGLVGAFLGHAALGYELTLWSIVGIIAVSGVVVNDNLVLISAVNEMAKAGERIKDTVVKAVCSRFRSIVLTSLTTFIGVAPLILENSAQARFLIPMAISLAFGVLFATLITLLIVPCLYLIGEDARLFVQRLQMRIPTASEDDDVEQAYANGRICGLKNGSASNPYLNEVLHASWEAGFTDECEAGVRRPVMHAR